MTIPITNAIPMCTCFRILQSAASSFLCAFRISTVKEVVRAVKADPAAEYAEAINPIMNRIPTMPGSNCLWRSLGIIHRSCRDSRFPVGR